jgi:septin family protein
MTEADAGISNINIKLLKDSKENRYYHRHREEILAKRRQKKEEDPEYLEKMRVREEKRLKREQDEQERALKRELRRAKIAAMLSGAISSPKSSTQA